VTPRTAATKVVAHHPEFQHSAVVTMKGRRD
jgi:hypothetical protein